MVWDIRDKYLRNSNTLGCLFVEIDKNGINEDGKEIDELDS